MTQSIQLYGFGSFFYSSNPKHGDIDILIVHERIDPESIAFALRYKSVIVSRIPNAHLTILSKVEERELNFIQRSGARFLGTITDAGTSALISSRLFKRRLADRRSGKAG
jgi:hypothetical protein